MASQDKISHGLSRNDRSGLEGQLRNMILNNGTQGGSAAPGNAHPGTATGPPPGFEAPAPSPNPQQAQAPPAADFNSANAESPKPSRKRLNQAQRRQMSSQLNIAVDLRSRESPPVTQPPHQRGDRTFPHPPQYGNQGQTRHYMTHNSSQSYDSRAQTHWHGAPSPGHQPPRREFPHRPAHHQSNYSVSTPDPGNSVRRHQPRQEDLSQAAQLLDRLAFDVVSNSEIGESEIVEKETFRQKAESLCRQVLAFHEIDQKRNSQFHPMSVELKCFGSLASGFATKASDMDLGLISPFSPVQPGSATSPVPRMLEKALLEAGLGAKLLTKTRVPIIKLCEKPPEELYQKLLAERKTWEDGQKRGGEEGSKSSEPDQDVADHVEDAAHDDAEGETEAGLTPSNYFTVPSQNGEMQRYHLEQTDAKNIPAYFGLAKRVLRKAGGRDVTMPNHPPLSAHEQSILNSFCQAFVNGLQDETLKHQLSQYPFLAFTPGYDGPDDHTLQGVFVAVEGEQILQTWHGSAIKLAIDAEFDESRAALKFWRDALHRRTYGLDPVGYSKDLQVQFDRVKKVPSVQLSMLEQEQHETPTAYYSRAAEVISSIQKARKSVSPTLMTAIMNQYVRGIHQGDTRSLVLEAWQQAGKDWNLETVARRHSTLHLASELVSAVKKELYDAAIVADIEEYVSLLRQPLQLSSAGKFILPSVRGDLVDLIRALKDPHHHFSSGKPRYKDILEFPKEGAGVQCDINFSAHIALHNTALLRSYSLTDRRVRPMVLFIKHWAKRRGINTSYKGTLSSYGYVLMVLHYLVNVSRPFVCPNLQQLSQHGAGAADVETVDGTSYDVSFWRDDREISALAQAGQLNWNREPIGALLAGFFEYFAQGGMMSNGSGRGFDWGRDVLSLRTQGGIVSKQSKGWTGAKTLVETNGVVKIPDASTVGGGQGAAGSTASQIAGDVAQHTPKAEVKEVRLRYLFAIEDPFELDHNVARTVTHNGIVGIRDEFRRAWRIIRTVAQGRPLEESLLDDVNEEEQKSMAFQNLLDDIHGVTRGN